MPWVGSRCRLSPLRMMRSGGWYLSRYAERLRERRLPRFAYDKNEMLASLDRLAALEKAGARIVFGHDPEFWQTVPQAPLALI